MAAEISVLDYNILLLKSELLDVLLEKENIVNTLRTLNERQTVLMDQISQLKQQAMDQVSKEESSPFKEDLIPDAIIYENELIKPKKSSKKSSTKGV